MAKNETQNNAQATATETKEVSTVKRIEVLAKQVELADGRKFTAYKAVQKNGKIIDCKFRKSAGTLPGEDFYADVDIHDMNMARNVKYPCVWIAKVQGYTLKSEALDGALAEGDIKALNEAFGE